MDGLTDGVDIGQEGGRRGRAFFFAFLSESGDGKAEEEEMRESEELRSFIMRNDGSYVMKGPGRMN